jgi:hypothetical protein
MAVADTIELCIGNYHVDVPYEMIEAGAKAILELDASGVMSRSEAEMLSEEVLKYALAVSDKSVRIAQ